MKIITHEVEGVWLRFPGNTQLDARKVAQLVEQGVWTWRDLKKHGLQAAEPFVAPVGKVAVGEERFSEDGKAQLFDVEDAPTPGGPFSISPLQARKALRASGLRDQVEGYIATLPEDQQEEWEYAVEIRRDNAIISGGASLLGMTEQQVDDLFRLGATL